MNNILVLTEHYPSNDNIYNYMFVHSRVKEYLKLGYNVKVLYLSNLDNVNYLYEGVDVYKGSFSTYKKKISDFKPDVIFTHSPKKLIINNIRDIKEFLEIPNYTWIHGVEALSIFRRTFNITGFRNKLALFTKGLIMEFNRVLYFRKYIKEVRRYSDNFIFVSNWMKKITEQDNYTKINNFKIIPNFIDTASFIGNFKRERKSLLIIRSFETKKYANDISMEVINRLNILRNDFKVTIYGDGKLFDEEVCKLRLPPERLLVSKKMLSRETLKNTLADDSYGFFLCPTRQDAQGVTMCEAMSSGLVIVTNPSTAIPEFVHNSYAIINNDIDILVSKISDLMDNEDLYIEKARKGIQYINDNLSSEMLISRELELLNE